MKNFATVGMMTVVLVMAGCANQQTQYRQEAMDRWQGVRVQMVLDVAEQQLEQGDLAGAQQGVMQALRADEDNVAAHLLLGRLYLEQDRLGQARTQFETCLAAEPDLVEARYYLGVVYEKWGQLPQAEQAYRTAWEAEPDHTAYVLALVEVTAAQGRTDEALALIDQHVDEHGPDVSLLTAAGNIHQVRGDFARAARVLEQALRMGGDRQAVGEALAYAYSRSGQPAQALVCLEQLPERGPAQQYLEGQCYLSLGQYHRAARCFETVTQAMPDHVNAWAGLAQARLARGEYQSARRSSERALVLQPENLAALMVAGCVALKEANYRGAETIFRDVLQSAPDNVEARCLLSQALQGLGQAEQARRQAEQALALNPQDELARAWLAQLGVGVNGVRRQ